jgi:hypothetical protein
LYNTDVEKPDERESNRSASDESDQDVEGDTEEKSITAAEDLNICFTEEEQKAEKSEETEMEESKVEEVDQSEEAQVEEILRDEESRAFLESLNLTKYEIMALNVALMRGKFKSFYTIGHQKNSQEVKPVKF